jgi:Protein of unknown function (DUF2950)
MSTSIIKTRGTVLLFSSLLVAVALCGTGCKKESAPVPKQQHFARAEDAVVAMVDAVKANDQARLTAIFGPEAGQAMQSGDPVADQRARDLFVAAYDESATLSDEDQVTTLHVGSEDWPFPIPLVKEAAGWRFDTAAGIDELRYRRIGRNELATIGACEAYAAAQQEYAQKGHDGKPAGSYAQKFISDPGKQDGLYWEVKPGEADSPLGELVAKAAAEGYTRSSEKPTPFRGYYFRILTAQGPSADGGAKSYVVNGDMRNGFALAAWPAEYGKSGVMTFLVDQHGVVYQKDLGEETAKIVGEMKAYDPGSAWEPAAGRDR